MFSTSMIASSTTTPIATTSPASTITLMVVSRRSSTRIAAISESGIAIRLMNAVRHSNRKAAMISTTSRHADQQRRGEVVDRLLDEGRRPEDRGVDLHAGKPGLQLVDRLLDALRDLHRVGAPELLDDQQQAVAVVHDALAPDGWWSSLDDAEIIQAQDAAVPAHDRHLGELLGACDRLDVADVQALAVASRRTRPCRPGSCRCTAARRRRRAFRRRLHHAFERDAVLGQLGRVDLDVPLLQPLAIDVDRRNAGHAQQPLPDLPVGDRGHLDQAQLVRGEADLHDPARSRKRRHH